MTTITRDFCPADRYLYDFKVLTTAKGWAQLDSRQDASYFGQWISPTRREIFCYCEGDLILTHCETDADLLQEMVKIAEWNTAQGYRPFASGKAVAIDPGSNEELEQALTQAGLGEYLH